MFIYSLPLFFNSIGFASPLELLIITLALLIIFVISAPQPLEKYQLDKKGHYFFSAWTGTSTLKWVFWPFFIVLNGGLYVADTLAKSGLLTVSSWDDVHFMFLLPIIWWLVAVWRCSAQVDLKIWAGGARLLTFAVLCEYALKLVIRIDYPRLFFNCEELLLDYGSCF